MITSSSNAQVKNVIGLNKRAKARRQQGLFVAEGVKMFQEAPREWIQRVYVSESFEKNPQNAALLDGVSYETAEDRVFAQMSDTQTPQGILCLVNIPQYSLSGVLAGENPLILVLEDLQDPGNVGTILRTGEGAGVTGVILSRNTADLFNPKTIRSTMGSVYRMPFFCAEDMDAVMDELGARGIRTCAAHLRGEREYTEEDYRVPSAFLIGNEGNGLSDSLSNRADRLVRIPMEGRVESLNAAIASAVLMYEANRQRRNFAGKGMVRQV